MGAVRPGLRPSPGRFIYPDMTPTGPARGGLIVAPWHHMEKFSGEAVGPQRQVHETNTRHGCENLYEGRHRTRRADLRIRCPSWLFRVVRSIHRSSDATTRSCADRNGTATVSP